MLLQRLLILRLNVPHRLILYLFLHLNIIIILHLHHIIHPQSNHPERHRPPPVTPQPAPRYYPRQQRVPLTNPHDEFYHRYSPIHTHPPQHAPLPQHTHAPPPQRYDYVDDEQTVHYRW